MARFRKSSQAPGCWYAWVTHKAKPTATGWRYLRHRHPIWVTSREYTDDEKATQFSASLMHLAARIRKEIEPPGEGQYFAYQVRAYMKDVMAVTGEVTDHYAGHKPKSRLGKYHYAQQEKILLEHLTELVNTPNIIELNNRRIQKRLA